MKTPVFAAALAAVSLLGLVPAAQAQTERQPSVYGEIGFGAGQTLFFGDIRTKLRQAIRANDFEPGIAGNLLLGFYVAPERWKGFGLGPRLKFSGGGGTTDDQGGEYFFNYYNLGLSAKYYPLSREFNRGLYARATVGTGQLTTKHQLNDPAETYLHQFAIGSVLTGSLGWTFPLKTKSISLEGEFESGSRNGTISGVGDGQVFRSGQVGVNGILTF
ncbi:hypothetical protein [Hymenobacter sp.]|uniref:hypothetical protein n=1 Tax=Hymenobacter sp. TaxID=1898978 RepID=UPI00286CB842|nr:hypothetical protein [Hymenobacter sp.]